MKKPTFTQMKYMGLGQPKPYHKMGTDELMRHMSESKSNSNKAFMLKRKRK